MVRREHLKRNEKGPEITYNSKGKTMKPEKLWNVSVGNESVQE